MSAFWHRNWRKALTSGGLAITLAVGVVFLAQGHPFIGGFCIGAYVAWDRSL